MEPNAKLFRAIVILGAALTAPGCEGGKCGPNSICNPPTDAPTVLVDGRLTDAGPPPPTDADTSDVILIL